MNKNPKKVIVYAGNGKITKNNPDYDPTKCEKCGLKHRFFQKECKK